ncbi:ABC transporter permease [Enterovirga rhinocerotis]|uniref:Putative spermidine/putrescine transport system permease protein n=1 Tax=Enterovirga rhinocerotis TaxID=1339210 RepID=A0A4V3DXX6_9HYPH|nr:ABC transporter permease [Enterovirga rhinocerotis]TDR90219.1 putative spermidine/putrescine transport system permease protein [Enterovirga rhinocerotis]
MIGSGTRALLFAPMGLLLAAFLMTVVGLVHSSAARGLAVYVELLGDPGIRTVLVRTVIIATITTAACAVLGYPLALFLSRSRNRNLWLILVISPWLVSIVVRTFGWMVLLGSRGLVNTTLQAVGATPSPIRILFTPTAVVLGLTHVFLPFMVIAILSSLLQLDRRLEEASRILGATRWQTFRAVTLPLSVPGLIGGCSLVLLMATGAIVTPLLLGGLRDRMLGTQIYTEVFQVFNFERASAMAVILLATALILVIPLRLVEGRMRRRLGAAR